MVREALIQIEDGPVLGMWVPGHDARAMTPAGRRRVQAARGRQAAPADSLQEKLAGRAEGADRSQQRRPVLHGAAGVGEGHSGPDIRGPGQGWPGVRRPTSSASEPRKLSGTIRSAVRVLAVRPMLDQPYASLTVQAVLPGGRPVPLLLLRNPRQEWPRRYWLADPVELPRRKHSRNDCHAHGAEPGRNSHAEAQQLPGRARLCRDVSRRT